jgi:hypothetical protein
MKTFSELYEGLIAKFFNKSKLKIQPGTVIDSYMLATAESLHEAHLEIEKNKNPYLYTKLSGDDIDSEGYMFNCPRQANESDSSYLYRLMNWTQKSEASNKTAIDNALMNLTYASYALHVPLTEGVGTGTVYIIPKSYDIDTENKAIAEVQQRLSGVVSPGSYMAYVIPEAIPVKVVVYIGASNGDMNLIENNIKKKVTDYINGIAVGEFLEVGQINKIGINEPNVDYFNVVQLYIGNKETTALNILQQIESKFIFDEIIWWTAVV